MNADARVLFNDGERAVRSGDLATARLHFLDAARAALDVQLWRAAIRCFRHALELDLFDRDTVAQIAALPPRVVAGRGWDEYRRALDGHPGWPAFGCRSAQIVIGDLGAVVECPPVGPVLELIMSERDLVEIRPDARFAGLPSALALIVARRALWPVPRERSGELMDVRVIFDGRQQVRLDEHGEWEPIVGRSQLERDDV